MKSPSIASLALVLALSGCASEKEPIDIGFDEDTKEWFWGANFKTFDVPPWTELKCEVIALASDRKTVLASYEYPHIVANNGVVVPLGDFAILPSAEKSLVKAIKTFKITCKKW